MPTLIADAHKRVSAQMRKDDPSCAIQVHARLVSLNGGVVLGVCIILSAFFAAALMTERSVATQAIVFSIITVGAWLYLIDAASERLLLVGDSLERTSLFGRLHIPLVDLDALLLVHEGLNQEVGIESITARYRDGHEERLPLGPCWRRSDLEEFLSSVEKAMGRIKLLEEVR